MIIDVTNEVYTTIKSALTGITVLQHYPSTTATFPCVIVEELDNTEDEQTIDTYGAHYSNIVLEINIFSNTQDKISQVKGIRNQIDSILSGTYRMTRNYARPVPNFLDTNVYRYQIRYTFKVDSTKTIYRG